ncbi:MAG: PIN domain-containing protein [Gammaproteobacteria bacterium]|nr:PIN domain-containing protein [Gammaproteobacteria bacterium]
MTRYLCDTSGLVAAVCTWHEHHDRTRTELQRRSDAGEKLVLAAHSLVETYAVLTRLPGQGRLRVEDAMALIEGNWRETPVVHLTPAETWGALHQARRRSLAGGQIYDVLVAVAALKAGASTILTWNVRHFVPFADEITIGAPP